MLISKTSIIFNSLFEIFSKLSLFISDIFSYWFKKSFKILLEDLSKSFESSDEISQLQTTVDALQAKMEKLQIRKDEEDKIIYGCI